MAITKPGFKYVGELDGGYTASAREYTVTDTTAIAAGDCVVMASGKVTLAGAAAKLWGVAASSASVADSGAKIKVYVGTPTAVFEAQSDGADFAVANVCTYFDIIVTTGAQGIDISETTATKNQWLCIGLNPNDTSKAYFVLAERQLDGYALVV